MDTLSNETSVCLWLKKYFSEWRLRSNLEIINRQGNNTAFYDELMAQIKIQNN